MIELKNLNKSYGILELFRSFSLTIERGEFLSIMGPSGCGKTTLLSIMATLERADAMEYFIDGVDIDALDEDELAKYRNEHFGFVFQSSNMIMHLNVKQNILLPFLYGSYWDEGTIQKRMELLLASVGLSGYEEKKVATLSGGEQQRIAIVRALIKDPQIIFADEPTGSLDAENSKLILEYLQKLCIEQNKTVIMVTHDLYAAKYSSRIVKLEKHV